MQNIVGLIIYYTLRIVREYLKLKSWMLVWGCVKKSQCKNVNKNEAIATLHIQNAWKYGKKMLASTSS